MSETDWTKLDALAKKVLDAGGGIAHVSAFDAAGITRRQVGALRGRGVVQRARTGWLVDPELPWQVKHAVTVGGIAACVTAAALWGLPVPPGAHLLLHVLVDGHATRLRHNRDKKWVLRSVLDDGDVALHRCRLLQPAVRGRTGLVDTLLMLIDHVPLPWAVAALDAALHVPRGGSALLDEVEFARFVAALPLRKREILALVDRRAESCLETLLRVALVQAGIVDMVLQAVPHAAYRVDFLIGGRLVVEVDGAAFHDPEKDRQRDEHLRSLGYEVLRFSYDDVIEDLAHVVEVVRATLKTL